MKIIAQHKSLITNLIAFLLSILALLIHSKVLLAIALFALSGAITNWLAVHMLFEKIPLLYGSGIIPNRFEDFKGGIKTLIIEQFFSSDNINNILTSKQDSSILDSISERVDYEETYQALVQSISISKLGSMLAMFGGVKILDNAKDEIMLALEQILHKIINDLKTQTTDMNHIASEFHKKAEQIIDTRLAELTPNEVKNIIAKMIKAHLGWLVVWGGVFGGMIGAISTLL
ncbi:MAG: DUF445 domain-containing protein [Rickettsiales bacterium]|jgi:uncharacterized membrane protein YheB (UPF0754 family)|nr:DUF445 domain-containing protein [Rickettsiales bacterium]